MKHCLKTKFKNLFCNEFFIQTKGGRGNVAWEATTLIHFAYIINVQTARSVQ